MFTCSDINNLFTVAIENRKNTLYEPIVKSEGVHPVDAQLLTATIELSKPKIILEIGTNKGWSAGHMVQNVEFPAMLVTCDTNGSLPHSFSDKRVHFIHGNVDTALQFLKEQSVLPIDMCFIDGDHSYSGVAYDAAKVVGVLSKDALVVAHDVASADDVYDTKYTVDAGLATEFNKEKNWCKHRPTFIDGPYCILQSAIFHRI